MVSSVFRGEAMHRLVRGESAGIWFGKLTINISSLPKYKKCDNSVSRFYM
jgi:hypothetical protein